MARTETQPEAEQPRDLERIAQETGEMLNSSLFDRLVGQEAPDATEGRQRGNVERETLGQLITSLVQNENVPPLEKRQQINNQLRQIGESLGAEGGASEVYGHLVLDRLEQVLTPERVDPLREDFEEVRADVIPAEREQAMERAMEGFSLPHTVQDVENIRTDHPYLYVHEGAVRVRTDIVGRDIETLSGPPPLPGKAGEVAARCRALLEELKAADPTNEMTLPDPTRPRQEMDPMVRRAANSVRMLLGIFFATMAAISFFIERKKDFPTVAAVYAGLAALTLSPGLFSGPLKTLRGQMEFLQTPDWDALVTDEENRGALTGERGEDFFRRMTEDSEVRMLFSQVKRSEKDRLHKLSSADYYEQLGELGVPEQHIAFLRDLEQRNHSQWEFLLHNIQRVQSTDGQELLAGFAREGMNIESLGSLPAALPAPQPETYAGADEIRQQFGGLGNKEQGA